MIRVAIIDDSMTARALLKFVLERDPEITIVGMADNGRDAVELLKKTKPDIATLDLHMPGLSGLEVTKEIMSSNPIPLIIVTADTESLHSFELIEAGAVAVMEIPPAPGAESFQSTSEQLLKTVKTLAGVHLVKRRTGVRRATTEPLATPSNQCKLVAIGASTGGPQVIKQIVHSLPSDFPCPIVCVQHIARGFLPGFVSWLNDSKTLKVKIADPGEILRPGYFYLAPDDHHMTISKDGKVEVNTNELEYSVRPAVSCMFRAVAAAYGKHCIGVLLSGMGRDGSKELGEIRAAGGITIAQDQESCVVFGMPGEAVALGTAQYVLPADQIGPRLADMVAKKMGADPPGVPLQHSKHL